MRYKTKKELRQHIRMVKRGYSDEELVALSMPIIEKVLSHPKVLEATTVLAYYSLPDEVFTHGLVNELVSMGKTVLLPKVISDTEMTLHEYRSAADMSLGAYNIMEPNTIPANDVIHPDLAIIPGMCFDIIGHRLGRGKGYYDRLLSKMDIYKIGMCFPFQQVDDVPYNEYDIKMDEVIS